MAIQDLLTAQDSVVYGDATGIELGNALAIDVRANDSVAAFGETSSGDQTDVTTTDDGKTQDKFSLRRASEGRTQSTAESLLCIVTDSS
jgi:hypothetical protein